MEKPIILIAPEEVEKPSSSAFPFSWQITNEAYINGIVRAGGDPLMILPGADIKRMISLADGILLQGGADVDPECYGEERNTLCGKTNKREDNFHIALIREAITQKKPIFGICRGIQIINTALGGTLYQDESLSGTALEHKRLDSPLEAVHKISIEKDSFLSEIFKTDSISVNSLHHQMIKSTGEGVIVAARAEDGNIEAIEKGNIIAVQWHPEAMLMKEDLMLPLFKYFIKQCKKEKNI